MGNYTLGEIIGKGGMGTVYRAYHEGLDRAVAVKFIHSHLTDDEEAVQRFLREARLAAKIDHPNVVRVIDTGRDDDGRPYIVMEYLEGESLRSRLKRGPVPESEAVQIAEKVLAGLGKAHEMDIVHRDVKPGNIFLCANGTVKLVDFGIAKALTGGSMTGTGMMVGTPEYMSPEQAEGHPVDGRSDLYSLGIVMHEMLTGDVPFRADSPVSTLLQQVNRPPAPLPNSVSPGVRDLVARLLCKLPDERFSTTAEVNDALARAKVAADRPEVSGLDPGIPSQAAGSAETPTSMAAPVELTEETDSPSGPGPSEVVPTNLASEEGDDVSTAVTGRSVDAAGKRQPRAPELGPTQTRRDRAFRNRPQEPKPVRLGFLASILAMAVIAVTGAFYWERGIGGTGAEQSGIASSSTGSVLPEGEARTTLADGTRLLTLSIQDAPQPVAWSPDGSYLALGSYDDQVRVLDPRSGRIRNWGNKYRDRLDFALSPNGKAYASESSADARIWVVDSWTGSRKVSHQAVEDITVQDSGPVWSPDGRRIAYSCDRRGKAEIWIVDADGKHDHRVMTIKGSGSKSKDTIYRCTWARDSHRLLVNYWNWRQGGTERFTVLDVDTGRSTGPADGMQGSDVRWSSDNTLIAYLDARGRLCITNPTGSRLRNLTGGSLRAISLAWEPAGTRIAFSTNQSGGSDIDVVDAARGGPRKLAHSELGADIWWDKQSREIRFASKIQGSLALKAVSATGGVERMLSTGLPIDSHAKGVGLLWSPDGAFVCFNDGESFARFYVAELRPK